MKDQNDNKIKNVSICNFDPEIDASKPQKIIP